MDGTQQHLLDFCPSSDKTIVLQNWRSGQYLKSKSKKQNASLVEKNIKNNVQKKYVYSAIAKTEMKKCDTKQNHMEM